VAWRGDEGLLAATAAGKSLPVGELQVRRVCGIVGEGTALATLPDDVALLSRAAIDGVTFLATTPAPRDSDLAAGGIVLYALLQRAIDDGMGRLLAARQVDAGRSEPASPSGASTEGNARSADWRQVAGPPAPSSEGGFHAGVYELAGRLLAVNRPPAEDEATVVADAEVDRLLAGVPLTRFRRRAGESANLVEEVWRMFLVGVLLALVAEGLLSLPARTPARGAVP